MDHYLLTYLAQMSRYKPLNLGKFLPHRLARRPGPIVQHGLLLSQLQESLENRNKEEDIR